MSLFTFIHDLRTRFYHDFWYEVLRFDHAVMRFSYFVSFHLIPHRLLKADLSVFHLFLYCVSGLSLALSPLRSFGSVLFIVSYLPVPL